MHKASSKTLLAVLIIGLLFLGLAVGAYAQDVTFKTAAVTGPVVLEVNPAAHPFVQEAKRVTLFASITIGGVPAQGKKLIFYDRTPTIGPMMKGVSVTDAAGVATISFTAAAGAHTAFVKYLLGDIVPVILPGGVISYTGGQSVQSPGFNYTMTKVLQVSPANNVAVPTLTPDLTWAALAGAASYHVQVNKSSTFDAATMLTEADVLSPTTLYNVPAPLLTIFKPCFWRVQAAFPTGKSIYSEIWRTTPKNGAALTLSSASRTGNVVEFTASLTKTADGSPFTGKTINFYEDKNGDGVFVLKATAVTVGLASVTPAPGTVTKKWTTTAGPHTAYAEFAGDSLYAPAKSATSASY